MGRYHDECGTEISQVPYEVECGSNGMPWIWSDNHKRSTSDTLSFQLRKLKQEAEKYIDEVSGAVVTVIG
jgi:molecular chaperone DnaK (HSP70)